MKQLHRPDLYCWSRFDPSRNVDFHAYLWVREGGNVAVDPLPLAPHEVERIRALGGITHIVVTNSDHIRASEAVAATFGAALVGPVAEEASFRIRCGRWVRGGDEIVPGLVVLALHGSKTPGELALLLEETTLICGDLVRGQRGGTLNLLPKEKLRDPALAADSVRGLLKHEKIEAVLVGDGWPVFRDGYARLKELAGSLG